jgi:ankyrin repeat protein
MSEAFYDALRAGNVDRLAEILAAGADPSMPFQSHYNYTPLEIAVEELDVVDEIEPGGPIDAVVLLLRYGAVVDGWKESRDATPLLMAVMMNHIEAVRILLAAGAEPNVRSDEGDSPLRFCAQHGYLEMARLLLHCGADKTIHEGGGMTGMNALGFAATRLNLDMVRLLLAHGADPWVDDVDRLTVFDRLRYASLPEDPAAQERLQQIRGLFDDMKSKGPSPDRTGPKG